MRQSTGTDGFAMRKMGFGAERRWLGPWRMNGRPHSEGGADFCAFGLALSAPLWDLFRRSRRRHLLAKQLSLTKAPANTTNPTIIEQQPPPLAPAEQTSRDKVNSEVCSQRTKQWPAFRNPMMVLLLLAPHYPPRQNPFIACVCLLTMLSTRAGSA